MCAVFEWDWEWGSHQICLMPHAAVKGFNHHYQPLVIYHFTCVHLSLFHLALMSNFGYTMKRVSTHTHIICTLGKLTSTCRPWQSNNLMTNKAVRQSLSEEPFASPGRAHVTSWLWMPKIKILGQSDPKGSRLQQGTGKLHFSKSFWQRMSNFKDHHEVNTNVVAIFDDWDNFPVLDARDVLELTQSGQVLGERLQQIAWPWERLQSSQRPMSTIGSTAGNVNLLVPKVFWRLSIAWAILCWCDQAPQGRQSFHRRPKASDGQNVANRLPKQLKPLKSDAIAAYVPQDRSTELRLLLHRKKKHRLHGKELANAVAAQRR